MTFLQNRHLHFPLSLAADMIGDATIDDVGATRAEFRKRKRDGDFDADEAARLALKRKNNARSAAELRKRKKREDISARQSLAVLLEMKEEISSFGYGADANGFDKMEEFDTVLVWLNQHSTAPESVRKFAKNLGHLRRAIEIGQSVNNMMAEFVRSEGERPSKRGRKPFARQQSFRDDGDDDVESNAPIVDVAVGATTANDYFDPDPL